MSRLSGRPGFATDADAFMTRSHYSYTMKWKADVYRWESGGSVLMASGLPVVGGTLIEDSSNSVRRVLTGLTIAGEEWVPTGPDSPLAPFGQRIFLYATIDRTDGGWFPWLKMGEYYISEVVTQQPGARMTVSCADYSEAINEYLFLSHKSLKNKSVAKAVTQLSEEALPNAIFSVSSDSTAQGRKLKNYVAQAAKARWEVCREIAAKKGCECFFDADGNLVVRKDRTQDDEESIPGSGPDIGTVSSPIATLKEGVYGTLVAVTATVSRKGGVNGVRINLMSSKDKNTKDIDYKAQALQSSGAAAWGNTFGRIALVENINVKKITSTMRRDYDDRAKSLLRRRLGVVRYLDILAHPQLWVEPDDTVKIVWNGRTEYHFVQRVSFDIGGRSPMQIRTRQLSVTDPGLMAAGEDTESINDAEEWL